MSAEHDRFSAISWKGESILSEIVVRIIIIVTTETSRSVLTESVDIDVHCTYASPTPDLSNNVSARRHPYLHDNHHSYKIAPRYVIIVSNSKG